MKGKAKERERKKLTFTIGTKKYISHFGGDPSSIAIWGQSAGGGSVIAQTIGRAGLGTNSSTSTSTSSSSTTSVSGNPAAGGGLFTRALASSPFWVKTYDAESPQAQAIYDQFSTLVGCGTGAGSLACLKNASVQALLNASLVIDASHTYNTSSYTWAPVIDGRFLTMRLSEAVARGELNMEYGCEYFLVSLVLCLSHLKGSLEGRREKKKKREWKKGNTCAIRNHRR